MKAKQRRELPTFGDWHPADIVAALRKAGWSLRRLSQAHGLSPGTTRAALARSYPAGEERIAAVLDVHPKIIWPSRYYPDGRPRKRGPYPTRRADTGKPTGFDSPVNVSGGGTP